MAVVMPSRVDPLSLRRCVSRGVSALSILHPNLAPCLSFPLCSRTTMQGLQDAELSPLLSQVQSQPRPCSAAKMPTSHLGPRSVGQGWGSNPCPASAVGQLLQGWGQQGGARCSWHCVPCRAEQRRGHQPVPPSPGLSRRKLVRGSQCNRVARGSHSTELCQGVRVVPGPA